MGLKRLFVYLCHFLCISSCEVSSPEPVMKTKSEINMLWKVYDKGTPQNRSIESTELVAWHWWIALIVLISRWTNLTMRCSPRRPLRLEGAAASCAPAEACVSASEPSPGTPQGQPRAKHRAKVKSQWSSVSPSSLSAQQPIRRAKTMQVWK